MSPPEEGLPPGPLLIVLDMAGTTVAVADEIPAALRSVFAEIGLRLGDEDIRLLRGRSKQEAIGDLLRRARPDMEDPETTARHLTRSFARTLHSMIAAGISPVVGAGEALARLRGAGHKLVLTTGFDAATAHLIVERLGWTGAVDAVVTADDVLRGRPAPDLVFEAMARVGVSDLERVVVVGDTVADMECGRRAGAGTTVGVLTGAHDRTALAACPGATVLESVAALPAWLERRGTGG